MRTQKGLSQDELAEKIFVSRQAVSRWENGETFMIIDLYVGYKEACCYGVEKVENSTIIANLRSDGQKSHIRLGYER